ncbi:MAG: hypothetical protein M3Q08_08165 [Pseudomonadota bacterium]|nr:hypothetical protein [Pseudomonadota bacterium]
MRFLVAAAALTVPLGLAIAQAPRPAQAQVDPLSLSRGCPNLVHQADTPAKAESKRLGELPPGNLVLSVVRGVGRCPQPVIVRYGIGASQQDAPSSPPAARSEQPRKSALIR